MLPPNQGHLIESQSAIVQLFEINCSPSKILLQSRECIAPLSMFTLPENTQTVSKAWLEKRLEGMNVVLSAHATALIRYKRQIEALQEEIAELKSDRDQKDPNSTIS